MTDPDGVPQIPRRFTDPRPVVLIGTLAWLVATVVVFATDRWPDARPTCLMGLALGVLGYGAFWIQRGAAVRGDKGAQRGLT